MWIEELKKFREDKLIGMEILYSPEMESTNRRAHDEAQKGAEEGTVVLADSQLRGRGRLARAWHSPPGLNLYASVILRPPIPPPEAPQITLVAGVALARALERFRALRRGLNGLTMCLSTGERLREFSRRWIVRQGWSGLSSWASG